MQSSVLQKLDFWKSGFCGTTARRSDRQSKAMAAAVNAPSTRTATVSKVIPVVAVLALLALNAAYWLFLRAKGQSVETMGTLSDVSVLQASALAGQRAIIITADNRLVLADGAHIVSQKPLGFVPTKLAANADLSRVVGGSSDRKVVIWDNLLNEVGTFNVNGRVTGLTVRPDGDIAASYSVGLYTGRSNVGLFDPIGKPRANKRINIDATGLRADANALYYTDAQGNLVALAVPPASADAKVWKEVWRRKLIQPATQLELTAAGELLTGDEAGTVALFKTDGAPVWSRTLSEYKVRMVHDDLASGLIVAGDSDGSLFGLRRETGEPIYRTTLSSPTRSFLRTTSQALTLITERGDIVNVNLAAALDAQRQALIDGLYLGGSALLIVISAGALVNSVPRFRTPAVRIARQIRHSRTAYLLILPAMLLILVFSYYPTVMGLYFSFTNFNLSEPIKFIGLENFQRLLNDRFFWVGVGNMVLLLITGILKALTLPLLVAELVFWLASPKLKYFMRTAFIIPSIVPGVVGILLWKQIYQPNYGLLNQILQIVGLPQLQHAWLADEQLAIWAIIFAGFPWIGTFGFLILFGGLLNINRELFDASEMDGASAWERFVNLDLPLLRPQLRLLLFFAFLGGAQEYGGIWILTRGGPGTATYVPGLQMFLSISAGEFGYASAIGLVLAVVVAAVTVSRFRFNQTPEAP